MSTEIPITRSTRQVTRDATAGQTVFTYDAGPVWDLADLVVQTKATGASRFTTITTGFTLALLSGGVGGATATFAVAPRPTAGDPAIQVRLTSRRIHERQTDVSRAGRIHTPSVEREHDKLTTTLQELRRDIDQNQQELRDELAATVVGAIPDNSLPLPKLVNQTAGTILLRPAAGTAGPPVAGSMLQASDILGLVPAATGLAASLNAAIAAANARGQGLVIPAGAYTVTASVQLTTPCWVLPGATITLNTGVVLTFASSFTAAGHGIFTGPGTCRWLRGQTTILPEWFGAVADGFLPDGSVNPSPTNNATAINKAITAAAASGNLGAPVMLGLGTYCVASTITMQTGVTLRGLAPGGDWSGIAELGAHVPSRLAWTGAQTGNPFIIAIDNDIIEWTLQDFVVDGRPVGDLKFDTWGNAGPVGILIRSGKGGRIWDVTVMRVSYGFLQQGNTINKLCTHLHIKNLRIFLCYDGFVFTGLDITPPDGASGMTNSTIENLKVWGYEHYGIDARLWVDNNYFTHGTLVAAVNAAAAGAIGIVINAAAPTQPKGVGNDSFENFRILQVPSSSAPFHGPAMLVNNSDAPGGEPATIIFSGTIKGDPPQVTNGGRLTVKMRGQPNTLVVPFDLVAGGVTLTGNPTASYVSSPSATTLFSAQDFNTNFGGLNYSRFVVKKLEWVIKWDPGTTTGGVILRDVTGAANVSTQAPGAAGIRTDTVDLTSYMNTNWITGTKELLLQTRGDGTTPPTIYRSYLKATVDIGG